MAHTARWTKWLTSTDRVEVRLVTEGRTVLDFSVQYVAEFEGVSHNVVRFDSAHDEPHIDVLKPDGEKEVLTLPGMDKRTPLTYALDENPTAVGVLPAQIRRVAEEMNREEQFRRNHELFQLFMEQALDSPALRESIPDGADLIFLPENDPELRDANVALAEELRAKPKKPVFVRVSYVAQRLTVLVPKMELVESI